MYRYKKRDGESRDQCIHWIIFVFNYQADWHKIFYHEQATENHLNNKCFELRSCPTIEISSGQYLSTVHWLSITFLWNDCDKSSLQICCCLMEAFPPCNSSKKSHGKARSPTNVVWNYFEHSANVPSDRMIMLNHIMNELFEWAFCWSILMSLKKLFINRNNDKDTL